MFCANCGKKLEEGQVICPSCGEQKESGAQKEDGVQKEGGENTKSMGLKEFHFTGVRGRADGTRLRELCTDAKIDEKGEVAVSYRDKIFSSDKTFHKQDVTSIDLPMLPVWGMLDWIRIILFSLLVPITYGLALSLILFSVKLAMSRQIRIKLNTGKVIKIPICQKAEASKFLEEFNYPQEEIQKNDDDFIGENKWLRRKKWSTIILFYTTLFLTMLGLYAYKDSAQNNRDDKDIQTMEESSNEMEPDASSEPESASSLAEADTQDLEMYLNNTSDALPLKIDNVTAESVYSGFTTINFDETNITETDLKEAIFGVVAWDSNMLPLKLSGMYDFEATYLYKFQNSNIAAGQTSQDFINLEERDFKYMQILLLECSDFDGNTWTNPAASYYEENYAGKKFDENTMNALVFNAAAPANDDADNDEDSNGTEDTNESEDSSESDSINESEQTQESPENTVSYTGDFFTDADNGVLYGRDGIIVDANGNAIPEYASYSITEQGYISNGDWCEEGYCVDSTGKIVSFQP